VTHYEVLGVGRSADQPTIRRAYLDLARRHHPDTGGDHARMRDINRAWAVLGDPQRRARYDLTLREPSPDAAPGPAPGAPRRGYEPDPAYPRHDDVDDEWDDLDDDRPVRVTVALPRWLRIVPAATLGASAATFVVGVILVSEAVLGLALMLLVLSVMFFLSAPFVALLAGHRAAREDEPA